MEEFTMSILDFESAGLDDIQAETVVEAGEEYKLRIVSFNTGVDKNGFDYLMPFFEVTGEPYCKEFGDYIRLPAKDRMSEKELNRSRARLSSFLNAFKIPPKFDPTEEVGNEGWAILGIGKDRDDEDVNKINRYVIGA